MELLNKTMKSCKLSDSLGTERFDREKDSAENTKSCKI